VEDLVYYICVCSAIPRSNIKNATPAVMSAILSGICTGMDRVYLTLIAFLKPLHGQPCPLPLEAYMW
jgi:hypothetical protein